jgi:thiamine pyrophosphokinase
MIVPDPIFIFLNGDFNPPADMTPFPSPSSLVIAVDGGAAHCLKLGWPIHVLIGDMDSLAKATLKKVKKANKDLEIVLYNIDKDQTDFDLTLEYIIKKYPNFGRIEVYGSLGGRWDMTVSNLLLPYSERYLTPIRNSRLSKGQTLAPPIMTFRDGYWSVLLLTGPGWTVLNPMPGTRRVSLIPISPRVNRVRLSGDFKYALNDEDLQVGMTKGISNELGPEGGSVFIGSGQLMVTVSHVLVPGPVFKKTPEVLLGFKAPATKSSKSPATTKKAPSAKSPTKKASEDSPKTAAKTPVKAVPKAPTKSSAKKPG